MDKNRWPTPNIRDESRRPFFLRRRKVTVPTFPTSPLGHGRVVKRRKTTWALSWQIFSRVIYIFTSTACGLSMLAWYIMACIRFRRVLLKNPLLFYVLMHLYTYTARAHGSFATDTFTN